MTVFPMRIVLFRFALFGLLFISMFSDMTAFAAKTETPAASSVTAPVTTTNPQPSALPQWRDLSREQRRDILSEWQKLPETTRSPFPVYRDMMIEQQCSPERMAVKNDAKVNNK